MLFGVALHWDVSDCKQTCAMAGFDFTDSAAPSLDYFDFRFADDMFGVISLYFIGESQFFSWLKLKRDVDKVAILTSDNPC